MSVELVNYWILEPVGIYHSSSHLRGNWLQSSAIVVGFLPIPGVQTNENFWGIPTEYDSSGGLFVMEILDTSASGCHSLICSSASWCIYCSHSQFISFLVKFVFIHCRVRSNEKSTKKLTLSKIDFSSSVIIIGLD